MTVAQHERIVAAMEAQIERLKAERSRWQGLAQHAALEGAAITAQQGASVAVPAVATLDMNNAGWREIERQGIDPESCEMQSIYHAMIAAAPSPASLSPVAPSPVSGLVEALERITKTPFNWRESGARAMGNIALDALAAYKAEGGEA
jgi:hypothetical protein